MCLSIPCPPGRGQEGLDVMRQMLAAGQARFGALAARRIAKPKSPADFCRGCRSVSQMLVPCMVTHLPVFLRLSLRFTRVLVFLLLMLHVLFHQARLRLALRGIRVGTDKGREGNRLAEKDKQDTSCNFLHKLSVKLA